MQMTSSLSGDLKLNTLPMEARTAHVFNEITSWSLLSLGVLCDAGCTATLISDKLTVNLFDKVVLRGHRDHTTSGMWMVDLTDGQADQQRLPNWHHRQTCSLLSLLRMLNSDFELPENPRTGHCTPRNNQKGYPQISSNHGGDSNRTP